MRLSDFDFDLPEDLIALRPVRPRPAARLLVAEGAETGEAQVADLSRWLRSGDLLVFNDTKVLPARLFGVRRRGTRGCGVTAGIEVTLIRREGGDRWRALAKPAKRLAPGDRLQFPKSVAEVEGKTGGEVLLRFDRSGADLDAAIAEAGAMPLPPYIASRRAADARDARDYQTVFAEKTGAVAAPTAALHFDRALLAELEAQGVLSVRVTLHVGAGTFLPVRVKNPKDHRMHPEWGRITEASAAAINAVKSAGGRIVPVGTTALRLIESAADADGRVRQWEGETSIFIHPGYRFRVTDGLMTNFHLPGSTLFMLVSALMGTERMQALYAEAIRRRFRFYSYGDSSLLLPTRPA